MAQPAKPLSPAKLKRLAREFLNVNRAASLATANSKGIPHVSIVYCIISDDLRLYFSTRAYGRKFSNLCAQPVVAMAFYNEPQLQMIQLTGKSQRINDLNFEREILGRLLKLRYADPNWPIPLIQLFERGAADEIAIIEVVPIEMTFADFSSPQQPGHYKPFFHRIL